MKKKHFVVMTENPDGFRVVKVFSTKAGAEACRKKLKQKHGTFDQRWFIEEK